MDCKYDVFISYSRKDYVDAQKNVIPGNDVSKIKEALTNAGITYWFDEEGIYSGDEFARVIVRNIKASRIFVFLSTANSNHSEWTASEISTANMMKKKIIPVRMDDSIYHDDVILYLSRLSHIDYADNPEKGRKELIRSIQAYLEEERMVSVQKTAEEQRRKEELERQHRQQEEEKKRQERIDKLEAEIAAEEVRQTEFRKAVVQKEKELELAKVDLKDCEARIQKLQNKLQDLREPKKVSTQASTKMKADTSLQHREDYKPVKSFTVKGVSFKMIRVDGLATIEDIKKPYYIGETQVTQALWWVIMGNNPSKFKGDDNPVEQVSWEDCLDFVKKLNAITGQTFRLPNDAEWKFAAKGGEESKRYQFSGSDDVSEVAWYFGNSGKQTHPVKQKKPNELGIFDMSGNVWEFCAKESTLSGIKSGPRMGGSFDSAWPSCGVSNVDRYAPNGKDYRLGLRLAL